MANTITLSQSAYKELLSRISKLEKLLSLILEKFEEPPYGSSEWWEWAHKKGLEAKKRGEYTRLKNQEDIENFFRVL